MLHRIVLAKSRNCSYRYRLCEFHVPSHAKLRMREEMNKKMIAQVWSELMYHLPFAVHTTHIDKPSLHLTREYNDDQMSALREGSKEALRIGGKRMDLLRKMSEAMAALAVSTWSERLADGVYQQHKLRR